MKILNTVIPLMKATLCSWEILHVFLLSQPLQNGVLNLRAVQEQFLKII